MDRDHLETNRANWDERVAHHVTSEFYDTAGFIAGTNDPLRDFELAELGDVAGKDLVHLQCHFGLDTLAWARRGAHVWGLDFSGSAIEAARDVADRAGLEATFVEADVHDAVAAFEGRTFDIVYTGFGALIWLPDMVRWAGVVHDLLRPGGVLYLAEFHPITHVFGDDDRRIAYDYFDPGPYEWDDAETYVGGDARIEHSRSIEWQHTLSEVVNAVIGAGFVVESLGEHPFTLFPRWPDLVQPAHGRFELPAGSPRIPLIYSLRARRPA